ncbi:MAG TPA: SRPBCC family protein [Vicinamibacterales bacterium]|nr:SRPBCC family protein [Vicinamibacterales bacterium]
MRSTLRSGATAWLLAGGLAAAGPVGDDPIVRVSDLEPGAYRVVAEFAVAHPAAAVWTVLTDYERIPRFMPEVRTSRVVLRTGTAVIVDQEAVARFFLFSKTLSLRLEIREEADAIIFRDLAGRSFARYEGRWQLSDAGDRTDVRYELVAEPAFDVPAFVLRRALRRDAREMVERLRAEVGRRAATVSPDVTARHDSAVTRARAR